jgi:hypothetical protein
MSRAFLNDSTEKDQPREEDRYVWGCGRSPHPHTYLSLLLEGSIFTAPLNLFRFCYRNVSLARQNGPLAHRYYHLHLIPVYIM